MWNANSTSYQNGVYYKVTKFYCALSYKLKILNHDIKYSMQQWNNIF
jgi:hypothetical protein